jgi:ribosomal protein S18
MALPYRLATVSRVTLRRASKIYQRHQVSDFTSSIRYFSSSNNQGGGKDGNGDDDPFGLNFDDGENLGKLGPTTPPKYRRDAVTGKFTGEEETELSPSERRLLNMDALQEHDYLVDRVLKEWNVEVSDDDEKDGEPQQLAKFARRIREDNIGMNTLGRSVESQAFRGKLEDGEDAYEDPSGLSKPLSPAEFQVFKKHMKEEYDVDVSEDDIPVEPTNERTNDGYGKNDDGSILSMGTYADNEELNMKWLSSTAVRFMDDSKDDDPFSDLLPSDLTPANLVNRRKAKAIPRQLLHHNNLALLKRYITPSGQIMNRVQSRLGAKDQRKVAKLIKRARAMGLIPTSGQFVVEGHGNIHEADLNEDRDWEQELIRRGLVVEKKAKASRPSDQEF